MARWRMTGGTPISGKWLLGYGYGYCFGYFGIWFWLWLFFCFPFFSMGYGYGYFGYCFVYLRIIHIPQNIVPSFPSEISYLVGGLEHNTYVFHSVRNFIIPIDKLIFFRGVGIPPTSCPLINSHNYGTSPCYSRVSKSTINDNFCR